MEAALPSPTLEKLSESISTATKSAPSSRETSDVRAPFEGNATPTLVLSIIKGTSLAKVIAHSLGVGRSVENLTHSTLPSGIIGASLSSLTSNISMKSLEAKDEEDNDPNCLNNEFGKEHEKVARLI
ncbi:hypothetical protein CIPAW_14G085400 [Carya illinoinensis]|uniref:Uncharacterized protein n=1 Tax=Carya illinoinensis TaxID=32201 RepID=A0A8T1NCM1_CARIL|nr:hypothetical protein CIPAW_14G085400 [Carya illinoinensis]